MDIAHETYMTTGKDMASYNVEQSTGDDEHSVITSVMNEFGTDVNGAMLWAQDYHTKAEQKFHAAMAALPEWDEPLNSQVKAYCHGVGNWVRANYEWGFEGKKYFGDRGLEIMEKRWVSLLPKWEDKPEVGPVFVDGSLMVSRDRKVGAPVVQSVRYPAVQGRIVTRTCQTT